MTCVDCRRPAVWVQCTRPWATVCWDCRDAVAIIVGANFDAGMQKTAPSDEDEGNENLVR